LWVQLAVLVVICLLGIPLCTRAARDLGGKKDPGAIVWDEIVSMPITFLLVPMTSPAVVIVGFLLNRVFDISKPPPARQLERLPDGLGIMADDLAAGVYSCGVLHLLLALGWIPGAGA
jgi:phosphatidylglycerophosphatase A